MILDLSLLDKNFLCPNDSNDINETISQSKSDFDKLDNYETNDYFPIEMNPSSLDLEELVENNSDFIKHEQKNQNKKKFPFKTEIPPKQRGRKLKGKRKRDIHTCLESSNIKKKIKIHSFRFIINAINDCIKLITKNSRIKFRKFDHSQAIKLDLSELQKSTIKDLLKKIDISPSFKNYEKDSNIINLQKLVGYSLFENFIGKTYLNLFKAYYNNRLPLKQMIIADGIDEKIVNLSEKTKSFYYLLENNEKSKEKIIQIAEEFFMKDMDSK